MSTVLYSLRTQLSGLQSLALDLQQSWAGASAVWRELGRLTQLTALHIMFEHEVKKTNNERGGRERRGEGHTQVVVMRGCIM
jgi:hypothetical protein